MINMEFTAGSTRPREPFSEAELELIDERVQALVNACEERPENLEVVSTMVNGPTGQEFEVVIYEDGHPDSAIRIFRDMMGGEITFVAAYGTVGGH